MIDRTHELPLAQQAALLRLSRSSLYDEPQAGVGGQLAIMRRIDALHLEYPFAGSRMVRDLLRGESVVIGRERVRTMMRRMCIEALYRRANTSKPYPGHKNTDRPCFASFPGSVGRLRHQAGRFSLTDACDQEGLTFCRVTVLSNAKSPPQ